MTQVLARPERERLNGIDSMRYLAAAIVVLGHSYRVDGPFLVFINNTLRFVVPFFFLTSGYMLTQKLMKDDRPTIYLRYVGRLLMLYLAWSAIYFVASPLNDIRELGFLQAFANSWNEFITAGPQVVFFEGISFHFWFFVSLALTTLFFLLFRVRHIGAMVIVSAVLYLFGIVAKSYADTPIGIHVQFDTRDYIFFSALPFALGAYLRKTQLKVDNLTAMMLFVGGAALNFFEGWFLRTQYSAPIMIDFVLSTIVTGTGAFLLAKNGAGFLGNCKLASFGKLAFGIYAIHILVAKGILPFSSDAALASYWHLIETPAVLVISTAIILAFRRFSVTRVLV